MEDSDQPGIQSNTFSSKPSRGWYGLALLLMAIGVAAFVASVNVAKQDVDRTLGAMQRIVVPGTAELSFDEPGRYLIYYEKIGEFEGEPFDTTERLPELPKLDVKIQNNATGEFVRVDRAADTETQMFNHGKANSEFAFTVPAPPTVTAEGSQTQAYTFTIAHENPIDDRLLLAIGPPVVGEMMGHWRGPFGGAAVLAFAFVISALTVLVTWMRRHGDVTPAKD